MAFHVASSIYLEIDVQNCIGALNMLYA